MSETKEKEITEITFELVEMLMRMFTTKQRKEDYYVNKVSEKLYKIIEAERRRDLEAGYDHWAKSHTPTWETDNLMGNLLGWPKDFKAKLSNKK